jgi:calnexin
MRFDATVAFGLFSVALLGLGNVAFADELDDLDAAPSPSTPAIEKPIFTVSSSFVHSSVLKFELIM